MLRRGATVLVDDGTCPAGQIKQVSAGSNSNWNGTSHAGPARQVTCIARK